MLDEDVQVELAGALKTRGVNAVSAQELGRRGLSDEEQLKFASDDNMNKKHGSLWSSPMPLYYVFNVCESSLLFFILLLTMKLMATWTN